MIRNKDALGSFTYRPPTAQPSAGNFILDELHMLAKAISYWEACCPLTALHLV